MCYLPAQSALICRTTDNKVQNCLIPEASRTALLAFQHILTAPPASTPLEFSNRAFIGPKPAAALTCCVGAPAAAARRWRQMKFAAAWRLPPAAPGTVAFPQTSAAAAWLGNVPSAPRLLLRQPAVTFIYALNQCVLRSDLPCAGQHLEQQLQAACEPAFWITGLQVRMLHWHRRPHLPLVGVRQHGPDARLQRLGPRLSRQHRQALQEGGSGGSRTAAPGRCPAAHQQVLGTRIPVGALAEDRVHVLPHRRLRWVIGQRQCPNCCRRAMTPPQAL